MVPGRVVIVILVLVSLGGCAGGDSGDAEVTVLAAASLQKTFTQLGQQFEAANPGTEVVLSFGGSSDLAAQLQQGAPGDLFASADTVNMDKVRADGLIAGEPTVFATNSMEIAVPAGNPAGVDSFASLADPGINVVVCAAQVPCGAATVSIERKTGVSVSPVSEESSVADVLGKVISGEADAGVVYTTDVKSAGEAVEGIQIPIRDNVWNSYVIGVLEGSDTTDLALRFEEYVLGPEGRQVLIDAGFAAP
jgi:molybdate transport system substrate-binding protein